MGIEIQLPPTPLASIGDASGSVVVTETTSTPQSATAAVNTPVVITINGVAGQRIRITHLSAGYSAAPAGGNLAIVVNGVTIWQMEIGSIAPQFPALPPGGLICAAGQNAVITLTAAGAAVTGFLNVASFTGP